MNVRAAQIVSAVCGFSMASAASFAGDYSFQTSYPGIESVSFLVENENTPTGNLDGSETRYSLTQHRDKLRLAGSVGDTSYDAFNFSSSREVGESNSVFQFGSTLTSDDQEVHVGVSGKKLSLTAVRGEAEKFYKGDSAFRGVDAYHFHGGTNLSHDYYGASMGLALGDNYSAFASGAQVSTFGLEDRASIGFGLTGKRFSVSLFEASRGDQKMADAVQLGWARGNKSVNAQHINHTSGADYGRISMSFAGSSGLDYSVYLQSGDNPLYEGANDTRAMFSFSGKLGNRQLVWNATETAAPETTEEGDTEEAKRSPRTGYIIAAGAVGLALIASGGSDSSDDSPRLDRQHAAGRRALNAINPRSVRENREYGGLVYRNGDGSYSPTPPVRGQLASVNLTPAVRSVPRSARITASYHTHGGPDPRFINEEFSPTDINSDNANMIDGYLGTPAGAFKFHNHRTGQILTLGRIAN